MPASGSHPGAGLPASEPLISALVSERCPACGARLAPAASWCSLCFADLRPAPPPAGAVAAAPSVPVASAAAPSAAAPCAAGAATRAPATDASTPVDQPALPARPTWPCGACGASVDVDLDSCPACGTGFLGALRNSAGPIELPVVGNLGRFSDRARVVLGAAVGLGVAFVLVLLTALLGR